eukprot:TRINITY_DN21617_c2_g1_i1.p1 TRINITY_DN21617_c2_g1~~TRINITY_DN21617_c2_g1_i1.p1  ORF type:complete len:351 (+),score=23.09 TRINITY_DN21617_c2_g1_i1:111-1163(+)
MRRAISKTTDLAVSRKIQTLLNDPRCNMQDLVKNLRVYEAEGHVGQETYSVLLRKLSRLNRWEPIEEEGLLEKILSECRKREIKCTSGMALSIYEFYKKGTPIGADFPINKRRLPRLMDVSSFVDGELSVPLIIAKLGAYSRYPDMVREFAENLPPQFKYNSEVIATYLSMTRSLDDLLSSFERFRQLTPKTVYCNSVLSTMISKCASFGEYRAQSDVLVIFTVNGAAAQSLWQVYFNVCHSNPIELIRGVNRMTAHGLEPSYDNLVALARAHTSLCERIHDHHYSNAIQTIKKTVSLTDIHPPRKLVLIAERLFQKTNQSKDDLVAFIDGLEHSEWMLSWTSLLQGKLK